MTDHRNRGRSSGPAAGAPPWGRADLAPLALLTALWAATAAVLGLHGDFPVSDDWAYARAVQAFLETGRIARVEWTWVPLVTNTLLGAGFAGLFGFSFETLRASNVFAAWTLLLASYALVRELGGAPRQAAFGAALVAWCPLTVVLAFTFMTDVVFAACVAASLAAGVRALRGEQVGWLVAAFAFAVAASLSRHFGLALLAALPVAVLVASPSRPLRVAALASVGLGAAAFVVALSLLFGGGDSASLAGMTQLANELREQGLAHKIARNGLTAVSYLGVFLAPAALARRRAAREGRLALGCALAAGAVLLALGAATDLRMPFGVDIVNASWLGWISVLGRETLPPAPPLVWWAVAAVGLTAGLHLAVGSALARVRSGAPLARDPRVLLVLFPALYLGVLLTRSPFFDRYLVPVLPALAALALLPGGGQEVGPRRRALAVTALAGVAALGLVGTRDNLTHHRARWALLAPLLERGVPARCIDGGFELGGWLAYSPEGLRAPRRFVDDDAWRLTLAADTPEGYALEASRTYRRVLPWREERLRLLHRQGPPCRAPDAPRAP